MQDRAQAFRKLMLLAAINLGLFAGLPSQAHAQQLQLDGGINWAPYNNAGLPPVVYQQALVAPGDYILQPGIPGCGDQRDTRVGQTAQAVATLLLYKSGVGAFLAINGGALAGQLVTQLQQQTAGTGGSIAQLASDLGVSPRYATCGTIVLVAPQGWHFIDAQPAAWNYGTDPFAPGANIACDVASGQPPYVKCRVPDAAWIVVRYPNYVVATFINWARETRVADLEAMIAHD